MVCDEDDPGVVVESEIGDGVEEATHRVVGVRDAAVQAGEIFAHIVGVWEETGYLDARGVGMLVLVDGVGTMGLEEACGEQKWLGRLLVRGSLDIPAQPALRLVDHVITSGVGDVDGVEAESLRIGALVLHAEQHGPIPGVAQQGWQCLHAVAVLEPVMREADESVVMRVLAGEERPTSR